MNQYDSVPFKIRRKAIGELLDFASNYFLCREKGNKPGQKKKQEKTQICTPHPLVICRNAHVQGR